MEQINIKARKTTDNQEELFSAWLALTGETDPGPEPIRLPVLSGSMLPRIPLGSILTIAPCTSLNIQRGDVIVFQEGDRLIAHRLLLYFNIGPFQVLFQKGDRNNHGCWITPDRVKGKVLEIETKNRIETAFSPQAASESLLHLFRSIARNLIPKGDVDV